MEATELLPGVDVSSFNGQPAAWQSAAGAIRWAGVKMTEVSVNGAGQVVGYKNPDADADWAYLAEKKLGRIAYLFGHPAAPVTPAVNLFEAVLGDLGLEDADGIMLDHETSDGLPPAAVAAWAVEVMAELDSRFGREPLLYTFLDFAWEGYCAGLGQYPLWIADPSSPEGRPRVPAPWAGWTIHQYETSGGIDRDAAKYPSLAAMQAALGKRQPKPPQEESMQVIHSVSLAGEMTIPAGRDPHALKWQAAKGEPSVMNGHGGAQPGAGTMLSFANLHISDGADLRFAVAEMLPDGKPGREVTADYRPVGGWAEFPALLRPSADSAYVVTVTNFGTTPAVVTRGTWEIVK